MAGAAVQGFIPGDGTVLEVQIGGNWYEVPGVSGHAASGGEAEENEVQTFRGVIKIAGQPGVPSVSASIPAHQPHAWVCGQLDAGQKAGTVFSWRARTKGRTIVDEVAGATAAIATTGAVTFAGTGQTGGNLDNAAAYPCFTVIEIGGTNYVVDTIGASGEFTVRPAPAANVSAAQYKLKVPGLERSYLALIRAFGNDTLEAGQPMSTTLELTPQAALPAWSIWE